LHELPVNDEPDAANKKNQPRSTTMKIKKILQAAAMGGAVLLSATANAQLEIPNDQYWDEGGVDKWRFIVAFPMLWAPSINLETEATGTVEITFKDILERLQMGMMGEFYLTKAWWGVFAKGMYMDIGQPIELDILGGTVNADLNLNLKMGMYDLGMSWRVWRNLRIITLGRLTAVSVDGTIEANICIPQIIGDGCSVEGNIDDKFDVDVPDAWDYALGVEYGWWMGANKRHGINAYADVQAWGDSKEMWQIDVRYMYRVSKLNNFWLGYRHYEAVMEGETDADDTNLSLSGPLLGWAFSF
jgi:hypothetical protein